MNSIWLLARQLALQLVTIPDIFADANEETIPKVPSKIGLLAIPNEGPKLADVAKKSLFDSATTVKDPSTTNILDGFSGKKLSWEKHATLFTEQKPQLPNNPPPTPNPFFQGYGFMGQKFSLPKTPDTATQTNVAAEGCNIESVLNESSATTPSNHTLGKF